LTKQGRMHVRVEGSIQGGKDTISSSKVVSLVGTWDKWLSKMEDLLIMGLVVLQLVIIVLF